MTVIICFIVLGHNLAEYKCQICIVKPASETYLADLCSCIHYIFISHCTQFLFFKEMMPTRSPNHTNTMAVLVQIESFSKCCQKTVFG